MYAFTELSHLLQR